MTQATVFAVFSSIAPVLPAATLLLVLLSLDVLIPAPREAPGTG